MMIALTIIQVVLSLALIFVVLLQHGKQQGLSGAIAGGAETFFGKNKGRTVDAMLKKFTSVIAILFIISSIVFAGVAVNKYKQDASAETEATADGTEVPADGQDADGAVNATVDENGNLVDADGNVVMTAEQMAEMSEQQAAEGEGTDAAAEGENADAAAEGENTDAAAEGENTDTAAENENTDAAAENENTDAAE